MMSVAPGDLGRGRSRIRDSANNYLAPSDGEASRFTWWHIGYTERLNVALKHCTDTAPLYIGSARLGEGNHPLAFTDVLVTRKGAPPALVAAAVPTCTSMHNADEAPKGLRIPRYLSPAIRSDCRNSRKATRPADHLDTKDQWRACRRILRKV